MDWGSCDGIRRTLCRIRTREHKAKNLVVPADRRTAEIFSAIIAEWRIRGKPLPINDVWIAAAAIRSGATLRDAHFREIPLLGAMIPE